MTMRVIEERIVAYGHGYLDASYLCVHSTDNPGATAANHVSYWSAGGSDYSVHLVSDWDACYNTVPYDRLCWQVGNGNPYVEGIEICEAETIEDFERGIVIAADACRERLAAHGWGVDRLITHAWASDTWGGSDHIDPLPYFSRWGYSWEEFVNLVENGENGMSPDEIWSFNNNADPSDRNAWRRLCDMHEAVSTWYNGADGCQGLLSNVYDTNAKVTQMQVAIEAQAEAIKALATAQGADPEAVAKAVADAVAAKLETIRLDVAVG